MATNSNSAEPFSPPLAALKPPLVQAKKTLPILGLQVVMAVCCAFHFFALLKTLKPILFVLSDPHVQLGDPHSFYRAAVIELMFLGSAAFVLYSISARASFGRWLGAFCLILQGAPLIHSGAALLGLPVVSRMAISGGPWDYSVTAVTGSTLLVGTVFVWAGALIFSRPTRAFFGRPPQTVRADQAAPDRTDQRN